MSNDRKIANKIFDTQDTFDLHDKQVVEVAQIVAPMVQKYSRKANTEANLLELEKEVVGRFADKGYLVRVDLYDAWIGSGPPIVEIVGNISNELYKYGFDHEAKQYEVCEANRRGEKFRGQRESTSKRKKK